jgi:hypothetical protein
MASHGLSGAAHHGVSGKAGTRTAGFGPSAASSPGVIGVTAASHAPSPLTNIHEIEKTTGLAVALYEHQVKAKYAGTDLAARLASKDYAVLRYDHHQKKYNLSPTSKTTIEAINDPTKADPIVGFAVRMLQKDAARLSGGFPPAYYVTFSKAVIERAIGMNRAKPDKGMGLAWKRFGENVDDSGGVHPAYHVYESIVPVDGDTLYDKVQHFVYSAASQYFRGRTLTDIAQYVGEGWDAMSPNDVFSGPDMLANNRGQKFGEELHKKYHPIRNYIRNLD